MAFRGLAAAAAIAALLSAPRAAASPASEPAREPLAPAQAPWTVTDAAGRAVTFNSIPSRIVLAGRSVFMAADALYAFPGAWSRLLGTTEIDQGLGNFLAAVDPRYGEKVTLPGTAGAEQIAALKPDAVILKSFMAETLGRPLEAIGIPVLCVDFETPEQYRRDLAVFGQLLRDQGRADEIWRALEARMGSVTARTAALSDDRRPSVLFVYDAVRGGEQSFNVPPAGWIQTRLVEMAGGRPVWKKANTGQGWSRVSFEQIAAWNPDWVFVASYRAGVDRLAAALREDPAWRSLASVRAGRLAAFPADYYSWDQPDVRWVLGLEWLATRLHPELFADIDVERGAVRLFSFLYGMSEEAARTTVIGNLHGGLR
jgi:iron complex transport system substrate-binding protein